jgi:hypothetical protein
MHPYATDSAERRNVILWLAFVSIALAYAFHHGIERLGTQIPWWADAPSVMGIFGVLERLFDRWLWRIGIWRRIRLVQVPDLNGDWEAKGETSFENKQRYIAKVRIQQTWTHISVIMETDHSRSHSLSASLLTNQPDGITLSYEYRNEPKPSATQTMHSHRGTCVLRLKDEDLLEGEYYSGRDRQNYGSLTLRRRRKN